jgi:hypothetical protein
MARLLRFDKEQRLVVWRVPCCHNVTQKSAVQDALRAEPLDPRLKRAVWEWRPRPAGLSTSYPNSLGRALWTGDPLKVRTSGRVALAPHPQLEPGWPLCQGPRNMSGSKASCNLCVTLARRTCCAVLYRWPQYPVTGPGGCRTARVSHGADAHPVTSCRRSAGQRLLLPERVRQRSRRRSAEANQQSASRSKTPRSWPEPALAR